jgi:hypothetical protein
MITRCLTISIAVAMALAAQDSTPKPPLPLPNEQWVSLFNGRDLTGWDPVGQETWEVVDGAIHGKTVTKNYGYLQTSKKYRDFQLSLRFKCVSDGNSGVFFHTAFHPGTVDVSQGLQFEIDPTVHRHTGGIYGDGREWIVWPSPENEQVIHPHDWNDYFLIVEGNHYIARLNGVTVVDFTDPKPRSFDGTIALQMHMGGGGDILFKDIFMWDLNPR